MVFVVKANNKKTLNQKISSRVTCNKILVHERMHLHADTLLETTVSLIDQDDDPVVVVAHGILVLLCLHHPQDYFDLYMHAGGDDLLI